MAIETKQGSVAQIMLDQRPALDICRAVYGGTLVLREDAKYLPQREKELDDLYLVRQQQAAALGAYRKTVRSLKAIVFRSPITLGEDVPEAIAGTKAEDASKAEGGLGENIDLAGQHLDLFAQDLFLSKLIDGHGLILVDWHGPEGARSSSSERQAMARPYWTRIEKSQIARPYVRRDDGAVVLESFAYFEDDTVRKGDFEEQLIRRVRQFDLVNEAGAPFPPDLPLPPPDQRRVLFRSWTRERDGSEWEPEQEGKILGKRMTRIPIVVDYADRTGVMRSDPPFLDVAIEVIKHFQIRSDRDTNLGTTHVPVFCIYGLDEDDVQAITIGNAIGLLFPEGKTEQGAEFVESHGWGLEHSRTELQDIEQRIASLGLSSMQRQIRQAETAEAHRINEKAQDSELAAYARGTRDALEEALQLTAMWMGLPSGGSVDINTDFDDMILDPRMVEVLLKIVTEGYLSPETMWDLLVAGGVFPETFDGELEKDRIANAGTAELAAVAEALKRASEERAAAGGDDGSGDGDGDGGDSGAGSAGDGQ